MSNEKKLQPPLWAKLGHGKPVSRRELLATGVISFSAYLLLPSWLSLISSSAEAQSPGCPSSGNGMIPFITVNLAGGAALQGNYVPVDQGGQRLANYDLMGLGSSGANLPIEYEFGNVPFAGKKPGTSILISQFLAGFRSAAGAAAAQTSFVAICSRARDDSPENRFSTAGLLSQAGVQGLALPNLGTSRSTSGIRQESAVLRPPAPLFVSNFDSLTNSLVPAGALTSTTTEKQRSALLSLVSKLSATQARKLSNDTDGVEIKKLLECANIKNEQVKTVIDSGSVIIDPRRDPSAGTLKTIWDLETQTGLGRRLMFAGMTYNVLKGNAGAAGIDLGSYDYHDKTRTTGDLKDFEAGELIGRMIATAKTLGKKLFIHVSTDGATVSGGDDKASFESAWSSDRGTANVGYMLFFDPAGRTRTSGFQINHFTSEQVSDERHPTGKPEGAAVAVFANYLKLNGRMDLFGADAANVIATTELDKVLKFG